jgi:hypothetical protein
LYTVKVLGIGRKITPRSRLKALLLDENAKNLSLMVRKILREKAGLSLSFFKI